MPAPGGSRSEPGPPVRANGLPPARLDHIFDPCFTTRAPGEGTGLGLYIVGEIVQEQGGAIAVSSPPAGGARFDLWLPCLEMK